MKIPQMRVTKIRLDKFPVFAKAKALVEPFLLQINLDCRTKAADG